MMDRPQYARAMDMLRSHPDWSDALVAESSGVDVEDVAAVRAVVLGQAELPREQEPTSS
jgi:hypothetical protein